MPDLSAVVTGRAEEIASIYLLAPQLLENWEALRRSFGAQCHRSQFRRLGRRIIPLIRGSANHFLKILGTAYYFS